MRERARPDSTIVRLKNGFEIKTRAVPHGELAVDAAGQKSVSNVWRVSHGGCREVVSGISRGSRRQRFEFIRCTRRDSSCMRKQSYPQTYLLPSGVNNTQLMPVRILFVLTCTNFVAKLVAGVWGYADGGRKSNMAPEVGWSISLSHGCFWYTRDCFLREKGFHKASMKSWRDEMMVSYALRCMRMGGDRGDNICAHDALVAVSCAVVA